MDIVLIFNGLGNQMSQYAFYLKKKQISKTTRFIFSKKSHNIHNGFELDNVFGVSYRDTILNKILFFIFKMVRYRKKSFISDFIFMICRFLRISVVDENDDYNFKAEYLTPSQKGLRYYVGGWHSEKYFSDIKSEVLATFNFRPEKIDSGNKKMLALIRNSNSVSVHVRRGDFMDSYNYNKLGAVCTLNYFLTAIDTMKSIVPNPHFFFFTNDYEWVKTNFNGPDFSIVNINIKKNSWKDMFLISNCKHNINSNGSFSWWSSWLNQNSHPFIIVPKNFTVNRHFPDIYPPEWIQLSKY